MKHLIAGLRERILVQFVVVTLVLVAVVILCAQGYTRNRYLGYTRDQLIASESQSANMVQENIQLSCDPYLTALLELAVDQDLLDLTGQVRGRALSSAEVNVVQSAFKQAALNMNEIVAISLMVDGQLLAVYDKEVELSGISVINPESHQQLVELDSRVDQNGAVNTSCQPILYRDSSLVFVGCPVIGNRLPPKSAYASVAIALNTAFLEPAITDGPEGNVLDYVVNESGTVILCTAPEYIGQHESALLGEATDDFSIRRPIAVLGWTFGKKINEAVLLHDTSEIFRSISLMYVGLLIFLSLFYIVYVGKMLRPLQRLAAAFERVGHGELDTQLTVTGRNEIARSTARFNEMVVQLSDYREASERNHRQMMEALRRQKNAELRTLESQIDAHFIFNTLNAINYQAIDAGNHAVSLSLKRLANILRYVFNHRMQNVLLWQEILWVEQYLFMQRERLGDRLNYEIEADDAIGDWPMRKMTLQPFIENSIRHGFPSRQKDCLIQILAKPAGDGRISIEIRDNGQGIAEEQLEKLRHLIDHFDPSLYGEGIGIGNVVERIYAFYGREASIEVESAPGEGACFRLILPQPLEEQ